MEQLIEDVKNYLGINRNIMEFKSLKFVLIHIL